MAKEEAPAALRARAAGAMWQIAITSYVLRRQAQRIYLEAYLDDHSRHVVAFHLRLQQRHDLVCETTSVQRTLL